MFYRYEIRTGSEQPWEGCFQYFFPDQRRYIEDGSRNRNGIRTTRIKNLSAGLRRKVTKNTVALLSRSFGNGLIVTLTGK